MAKEVITGAVFTLATVDYSDELSEATIELEVDSHDSTTFASSGWKENIGGLKGFSLTLNFKKDADMSGLDLATWDDKGTVIAFTLGKDAAAPAAASPEYRGSVLIDKWTPLAANVGSMHEGSVTWPGTGTLTRAVA